VSLAISPLAEGEVAALCTLAGTVWRHHYPPLIGTAQTEYMLAQRYDPAVIRGELATRDFWWDLLREDGALVAFASSFPADGGKEVKIDKLYVHPERQRRGHGGALIAHTCARAQRLGYGAVILAVNKRNTSAISAYRKYGFDIREAIVKDIGGGFVMDDYIMERRLERA
jgi:ribosomal protein S18 acetylase RimI-like enzyme